MLVDLNTHGTIILSTYRSGGTQLKGFLVDIIGYLDGQVEDAGEIDFNLDTFNFAEELRNYFENKCTGKKCVILLNNPFVISYLYLTGYLNVLSKDFKIIHLERKDWKKSLLSLAVWEEFIGEGLYNLGAKQWTEEVMTNFHNKLVSNPIPNYNIYLGNHIEFDQKFGPEKYLNTIIHFHLAQVRSLRTIANELGCTSLYYEEYEEYNDKFFDRYIKLILDTYSTPADIRKKVKQAIKTRYRKIPYISENFIEYYDDITKKAFSQWSSNQDQ